MNDKDIKMGVDAPIMIITLELIESMIFDTTFKSLKEVYGNVDAMSKGAKIASSISIHLTLISILKGMEDIYGLVKTMKANKKLKNDEPEHYEELMEAYESFDKKFNEVLDFSKKCAHTANYLQNGDNNE